MMPEGFEMAIDLQQMADLIAYLKSNGAAPKNFPENKPELVTGRDGSLMLPATKAQIFGYAIVFETEFKNIGYWHGADDYAAWTIRIDKAGEFDVHLDYACAESSAGNLGAASGGRPVITTLYAAISSSSAWSSWG